MSKVHTVTRQVIAHAHDLGLRHFFGIPGGGLPLDLIEAGRSSGVAFVNVAHESSAAVAAAYYGYFKKTAGLAMAVRGVGAANLVGGVANVHFERLPLVAICESFHGGLNTEVVQHCDQISLFNGISKYRGTLTVPGAISMIRNAFSRAVEGRPGPSVLNLPSELADIESSEEPGDAPYGEVEARSSGLSAARQFVQQSKRLAIVAGADVLRAGAENELLQIVEQTKAAVLVTMDARGVFPESHKRWAGVYMGLFNPNVIETRVFERADSVLIVGVDALMTHSPWKMNLPSCELTIQSSYPSLSVSPVARLIGDLKSNLRHLSLEKVAGFREDEVQHFRREILKNFERPSGARLAVQDILEITRAILPPEGVLLSETGAFVCMLEHLWPVDRPGTYFGTSGGRTMGLMIPAILGAKLAKPALPMIGLGGDGSLLMRLGELEVFARRGVAVPLIIINDQALGTIKSRQNSRGLPDCGLDFYPTQFDRIARACGLRGVTVDTPESFEKELRIAVHADRSTLIDVHVDRSLYQQSFGPSIGVLNPSYMKFS